MVHYFCPDYGLLLELHTRTRAAHSYALFMCTIRFEALTRALTHIDLSFPAVCPKQLDYFHEVQEFEAEMQKHSHRYPHDILSYCSVHVCSGVCTRLSLVPRSSLVLSPRPHPLTRGNGLVNQVEFLGLTHAFATM